MAVDADPPVLLSGLTPSTSKQAEDEKAWKSDSGTSINDVVSPEKETPDSDWVKGEPIISTGEDVSNYAVDVRDDEDPSLTFRSLFIGTCVAGLGATVNQIYVFKPVDVPISGVFLLLFTYSFGLIWSLLPTGVFLEKSSRWGWLGRTMRFINPGPFGLKEHAVATLIATTASGGSQAVNNFAVQKLFYDTDVKALTAIFATFSTAVFGYGLVGLLRPLTVYPSEMVYWEKLPTVVTFQSLHWDRSLTSKRLKLFWVSLTGMAIWEIFPEYIFPLLNGFSIPCLASQHASPATRAVFTNIFGGAEGNEGLGLLSVSFDWAYIGSEFMSLPLVQQANSWIGYVICYVAVAGIYYSNTWDSKSLPMLTSSIFNPDSPTPYNQTQVFGPTFTLNNTAFEEVGLPRLAGSYVWSLMASNWAIGGLIAHCTLFWGPYVIASFRSAIDQTQPDRHWVAMNKKYKEVPWWWYTILLAFAFFAGLIVVIHGDTTLPAWGYLIALIMGAFITPFSNLLLARMGNGISTNQLFKIVAGALFPGKPVANLYFGMWSHDAVNTAITLAGDLKVGQYLKIPPRVMFLTQVWGTVFGVFINYAVMASVIASHRELLLDPVGTNVWSGATVQYLNSSAVTWSLAGHVFGIHSKYIWVPLGLLFGAIPTVVQYFIWKRWPRIGPVPVDKIILPLIYQYAQWMTLGVTSVITTTVLTGVISQVYLRRRHPGWFRKYNYLLGGALDGGAQIMLFVLSFAVFGASGKSRPFPQWWGNHQTETTNVDYCVALQ
ncbi:oligopeptide transporter [Sistotremastrum niveocremeum HHB9708]|uniref:Oligopeptide transporter n=1 Tax=Sistotremastrum niveocremeum HHB9708 TaxID=1314777 RepID=A0A164V7B5_9AGAM|nr:oligopeptide transporter [Sistotremastrum niveocremeum HHB9708]